MKNENKTENKSLFTNLQVALFIIALFVLGLIAIYVFGVSDEGDNQEQIDETEQTQESIVEEDAQEQEGITQPESNVSGSSGNMDISEFIDFVVESSPYGVREIFYYDETDGYVIRTSDSIVDSQSESVLAGETSMMDWAETTEHFRAISSDLSSLSGDELLPVYVLDEEEGYIHMIYIGERLAFDSVTGWAEWAEEAQELGEGI